MTPPAAPLLAPQLFDILTEYASQIALGKVKPFERGVTAPALTFCENFYVQFFQNRLKRPIQRIDPAAKETAVRLRMELKDKKEDKVIILIITSFETLCDKYSTILGMNYGAAGKEVFLQFHNSYLPTLLERVVAWAEREKHADIEGKAKESLSALKAAMESALK
jgi:hypothetical protein